jgi:hypothetical protein
MNEQQLAAVKRALDDLIAEYDMERSSFAKRVDEIFKQALAAPVQEPVAWMDVDENGAMSSLRYWSEPDNRHEVALYTTPPAPQPVPVKTYHDGKPWPVAPKPWVGLTQEDKEFIELTGGKSDVLLAELVESKLKEKNHG